MVVCQLEDLSTELVTTILAAIPNPHERRAAAGALCAASKTLRALGAPGLGAALFACTEIRVGRGNGADIGAILLSTVRCAPHAAPVPLPVAKPGLVAWRGKVWADGSRHPEINAIHGFIGPGLVLYAYCRDISAPRFLCAGQVPPPRDDADVRVHFDGPWVVQAWNANLKGSRGHILLGALGRPPSKAAAKRAIREMYKSAAMGAGVPCDSREYSVFAALASRRPNVLKDWGRAQRLRVGPDEASINKPPALQNRCLHYAPWDSYSPCGYAGLDNCLNMDHWSALDEWQEIMSGVEVPWAPCERPPA